MSNLLQQRPQRKLMILTAWRLAMAVLVLALGSLAGAAEWFVVQKDPMADGRNPGTEARPFRTIQPAVDAARSGDTIYVKEGLYSDRVRLRSFGRPTHPIMLTAWKEDRVVIGSELRELPPADQWKPIDGRKSYQVRLPTDTPNDSVVILNGRPIVTQRRDTPPADDLLNWATPSLSRADRGPAGSSDTTSSPTARRGSGGTAAGPACASSATDSGRTAPAAESTTSGALTTRWSLVTTSTARP